MRAILAMRHRSPARESRAVPERLLDDLSSVERLTEEPARPSAAERLREELGSELERLARALATPRRPR